MRIKSVLIELVMLFVVISCASKNSTMEEKGLNSEPERRHLSGVDKSRRLTTLTEIEFDSKFVDIGNVVGKDTLVTGLYTFRNVGEHPLLIEYVNPDCTCTGYEFTEEKILPGEKGMIRLNYNVKNKVGEQKLYAVVRTNTAAKFYKLTLKMIVI